MSRRALTLVLPFYRNRGMLAEHQRVWADYPPELRSQLHVIVVDDGSPVDLQATAADLTAEGLASFRLFRILPDVRWNWLACRNLGMWVATSEWVLLTDIDHVLPASTLDVLTGQTLDAKSAYRLSRVDAPRPWPYSLAECPPYKPHPNTWFLTRALFDAVGGYDERLSGCYGTDGEFRDRVTSTAVSITMRPEPLIRYPREVIPDASTTVFTRKNDPANDADLAHRRSLRAQVPGWRPLRLTFPFEQVV